MNAPAQSSQVKSATRTLDIIEYVVAHPRPLVAQEIATALGIPVSSLSYLLSTLVERDYLVRSVGKVPDYEIYYLFLDRGRQVVRPNGNLAYILPNTFLFNVNASDYRTTMLQRWAVDEIIDCTAVNIFDEANVRNAILKTTRAESAAEVGYRKTNGKFNLAELLDRPTRKIPAFKLQQNNVNWGLLFKLEEDALQLVRKLGRYPQLNERFEVSQGYIPYRKKDLIKLHGKDEGEAIVKERKWHATRALDKTYIEELWGRSLSRYQFTPSGSFVRYGQHVASYVDMRFFDRKRLLIREITNPRVMATLVTEKYVNDPQIVSIIPRDGASLEVLWAIFNSRFASFYHFCSSPKATKGLFPKILVRDVRNFPVPDAIDSDSGDEIARLVRKAFQYHADGKFDELKGIEVDLDIAIEDLYNLSLNEREIVDRELSVR